MSYIVSKGFEEIFQSESPESTARHGALYSKKIRKLPQLILLEGAVGAGKTAWVHGFISGYLKKKNIVSSPSYSLVNYYSAGKKEVIHADFYRLQSEDDLESVGFWDLLSQKRVILVEWGTSVKPETWPKDLIVDIVSFEILSENRRILKVRSASLLNGG
jgi:tRNA threonylcarbamoyl adenosine modification protein YjeE